MHSTRWICVGGIFLQTAFHAIPCMRSGSCDQQDSVGRSKSKVYGQALWLLQLLRGKKFWHRRVPQKLQWVSSAPVGRPRAMTTFAKRQKLPADARVEPACGFGFGFWSYSKRLCLRSDVHTEPVRLLHLHVNYFPHDVRFIPRDLALHAPQSTIQSQLCLGKFPN